MSIFVKLYIKFDKYKSIWSDLCENFNGSYLEKFLNDFNMNDAKVKIKLK